MQEPSESMRAAHARHRRLTELFTQAVELDQVGVAQLLAQVGAEDAGLRSELEALLAHADDDPWLDADPSELALQLGAPVRQRGEHIGSYEVERLIGSGGVGDVYLAQQQRPRRLVAVKVMRQGMADAAGTRKFEFEAQLLARLRHPGIAQVFEAGVFEERGRQRPFFVMEYVDGAASLTRHAAAAQLDVRQRLLLFGEVCAAVAYGHRHGVAHCDLKPDNLLVDADGRIKVIDFGIARATDREPRSATLQTGVYRLAGTLPYMSPEQAGGVTADLDARTDVYSLGAILYELLAGRVPLDLDGVPIPIAAQRIVEQQPRPLGALDARLRGDLETIVGKCLAKERERRYADAGELGEDVRRFLADEAILARRPTAIYQLRMFTRRHRGLVFGSALALAALVLGSVVAVQQAVVAMQREAESRWIAYRANLAAAGSALANHDVAQAAASLDAAPVEHRGWEWRDLRARLDDSVLSLRPPGQGALGQPFFCSVGERRALGVWRSGEVTRFALDSGEPLSRENADALVVDARSGAAATLIGDRLRVVRADGSELLGGLGDFGFDVRGCDQLAIADGGGWLLLAGTARAVRICLATGLEQLQVEEAVVERRGTGVPAVAIAATGDVAFAAGVAGRAAVWRLGEATLVRLDRAPGLARAVAFSPDGQRLAMGMQDTTVGVWSVATAERELRADGHEHAVTAVGWSGDGALVLSGSLDRSVRSWRGDTLAPVRVEHGHERGVRGLAVDPLSGWVGTCSEDGRLHLWGGARGFDRDRLRGHQGLVFPTAFSADGRLVASAGNDGTVRLWSPRTRRPVATLSTRFASANELAFNADASRLVVASRSSLCGWDLDRGVRLAGHGFMPILPGSLRNITFAADGRVVLVPQLHPDRQVPAFDLDTGELTSRPLAALAEVRSPCTDDARRFAVLTLADRDPGEAQRVDSDSSSQLAVVRLDTGEVVDLPPLQGAFTWLPGGTELVVRSADDASRLLVLDVARGVQRFAIEGHSDRIYDVACSPDGTRLVSCGRDSVRLWALGRGVADQVVALQGHRSFVWSCDWSSDGDNVVTGSGDGDVRIWGCRTSREVLDAGRLPDEDRAEFAALSARLGSPEAVAAALRADASLSAERRERLFCLLLASHTWQ